MSLPSLSRVKKIIYLPGILLVVMIALHILYPLPKSALFPEASTVVRDSEGNILRIFLTSDDKWRMRVNLNAIDPILINTTIRTEDRYFHYHFGVNPLSLARAIFANIKANKIVSGASTITMQIARMIEPKKRNIRSKLFEMFRALQLEITYSKRELLEIYFNLLPYGGNIEGVGTATYAYLGKGPAQLSLGEATQLTVIPNSPNLYRPDLKPGNLKQKRDTTLRRLLTKRMITREQYKEARSETVSQTRHPLPFRAPHFTRWITANHPSGTELHTTLDSRIQTLCERLVSEYSRFWEQRDISQFAVVVVDNRSHSLKAMVGSRNFFDAANEGQVNGTLAPRSPGSTLKPFIYGLGLEKGLISIHSRLPDVPVYYGGYNPDNYDGSFQGLVTAQDALKNSLNVPAVNLLAQLKKDGLYALLRNAEIQTINQPPGWYGLALALGGCELTLLDLVNLYSMLANGGVYHPVKYISGEPSSTGKRFLSTGAAYLITNILSDVDRPDLPQAWEASKNLPSVAWKTGTSYGHRDAWSIGYTPGYTVGVWAGNFNGDGAPEIIGYNLTAPLLFKIFNALGNDRWFEIPPDVGWREVCAVSGQIPGVGCTETITEMYLPNVGYPRECTIHQQIYIDIETGYRLCFHCRQGREYQVEFNEVWPAKVATWLEQQGYISPQFPAHFPGCQMVQTGSGPLIKSPENGSHYVVRPGVPEHFQQLKLEASVAQNVEKIYWFIDGSLLWAGAPGEPVFTPLIPGNHTFVCQDDEGRVNSVDIKVVNEF